MRFASEYVQRNKPVIITGALENWKAMRLWGERYLTKHAVGSTQVTVDVTPNGRGDAPTTVALSGGEGPAAASSAAAQEPERNASNAAGAASGSSSGAQERWFVTPQERKMTLADFFALMRETRSRDTALRKGGRGSVEAPGSAGAKAYREVPYMQHQNSNLREELSALLGDVEPGLPWAEEVFGGPPEAINLWIGDQRSATSFHKDHYENLYAVVRGTKVFTLMPPCDAFRMRLRRFPAASYMRRRDVPPGARFGEVSPQPGALPHVGMAAAGGGGSNVSSGRSGLPPKQVAGPDTSDPDRLVAVLNVPGYQVLWSDVDCTADTYQSLGQRRAAQPLFYGAEPNGASSLPSGAPAAAAAAAAHAAHVAQEHAARAEHAAKVAAGEADDKNGDDDDDDDDDDDGGASDEEQGDDEWDAAGGAPLVAQVGPGEVLYLPSIWYHQVEQRCCLTSTTPGPDAEHDYVIAVNYWFDMKYDTRYSSFKLVEALSTALGLAEEPPALETL
ncbi:hypothetical protein CHLRE_03g175750v5 [Chlamydomonas reinhardtii]|uniref:JmjC domain-containing protein n=1 Tax=Chlamydomonas reinhardtii TaxID=3055 RepID=A0A2K3DXE4_CHLRE|nr:uncharacterized protein CHLRE_03g175750v5 [Chlamydomonas reinhardtii]PNW85197.1 hypothetical protein CHLRE_03g175750v5 [Chlamydomonas reinhardtii]